MPTCRRCPFSTQDMLTGGICAAYGGGTRLNSFRIEAKRASIGMRLKTTLDPSLQLLNCSLQRAALFMPSSRRSPRTLYICSPHFSKGQSIHSPISPKPHRVSNRRGLLLQRKQDCQDGISVACEQRLHRRRGPWQRKLKIIRAVGGEEVFVHRAEFRVVLLYLSHHCP